ncbi:MAG TPA: lipase maturation factor family protein [Polyangiaceae bacterium]|nr:lipase maturation factor family protein [Polyangiaceae bacterium]
MTRTTSHDNTAEPESSGFAFGRPFWRTPADALLRTVVLRGVAFVYLVAFAILLQQGPGLIGSRGILPAEQFLSQVAARLGSRGAGFARLPSVFWWGSSDIALRAGAYVGAGAALLVLCGIEHVSLFALLWILYLSFVHIGQIFWGYGWEILLCEAGFLAIFLAPARAISCLSPRSAASPTVIWLFRWLALRLMLGAGLIKIRGDECWRDLSCLLYHYETQPNPGPLSPLFHGLPAVVQKASVLFNHFVELVVPFGLLGPARVRRIAGALVIVFQTTLILSGNLSFLNWLTIVVTLACFDDAALSRIFPKALRTRAHAAQRADVSKPRWVASVGLLVIVALLSINPILNMLSPRQSMNTSFDPFELVNTYGAFGSVSRERYEVIVEGSTGNDLNTPIYREYEFNCKPGDPERSPCLITPYHYRLDWQMWFLSFDPERQPPWFLSFVHQLLRANPAVLGLLRSDPFAGRRPKFVRALLYRYRFTRSGESGTWRRELVGEYMRPVSLEDPEFLGVLQLYGLD